MTKKEAFRDVLILAGRSTDFQGRHGQRGNFPGVDRRDYSTAAYTESVTKSWKPSVYTRPTFSDFWLSIHVGTDTKLMAYYIETSNIMK